MTIPREYIDNYVGALASISEGTRARLEESLRAIDWTQDVATVRDRIIEVMQAYCGGTTDMAAMLAAEFYDGIRELAVGERLGAFAESGRVPEATDGAVRAFVQDLVDGGGPDPVIQKCLERMDYETRRAAATCITRNSRRDPSRPRYARIPAGGETCDFCIMLASRGPVYHTEASAGAVDHFHANCRCQVVPFFDTYEIGPSRRASAMSVEGYDPDALYDQYVDYMTDGKFRDRMARAADRAHGGDGNVSGRDTSHPMAWAEAARKGLVRLKSIGEITDYIDGAKSYEDLFERMDVLSGEWEHYGLSDRYREMVQAALRRKRSELIGR